MTTTHTPRTWRYVQGWPEPDTPEYQVLGDDDRTVTARTYSEDDARLIAQAPALLAALRGVMCADRIAKSGEADSASMTMEDALDQARAVIAQAERSDA